MVFPKPKSSFAPVIPKSARVLILGSLPGQKSIDAGEYYAHPRNRFWPVIAAIAKRESVPTDYQAKLSLLESLGVALWDVVREAQRAGSLDSNITGEARTKSTVFWRRIRIFGQSGSTAGRRSRFSTDISNAIRTYGSFVCQARVRQMPNSISNG